MQIILNQREIDKLESTIEILNKYSRIFSEMVKGESGTFHDTAASAAGMLESLLKETRQATKAE